MKPNEKLIKDVRFKLSPLKNEQKVIGWNCTALVKDDYHLGTGTSSDKEMASKIASSEYLERKFIDICQYDERLKSKFEIYSHPGSNGFALGYEPLSTNLRSICEALEGWAWSKWIDDKYAIDKIEMPVKFNELSRYFLSHFDRSDFYRKDFEVELENTKLSLQIGIVTSFKDTGVFVGTRVASIGENIWEHALMEAWRCLIISENQELNKGHDIVHDRIIFCSQNADCAKNQIRQATQVNWPQPKIKKNVQEIFDGGFYLSRTILNDYKNWYQGPIDRFVY